MGVLNIETPTRRRLTSEMTYYYWIFAQQAAEALAQTEQIITRGSKKGKKGARHLFWP